MLKGCVEMQSKKLLKVVFGGLMAALICVATAVMVIQLPTGGYANLGDCFVILSGCILGPVYGALAAGIGAGLADLFLGYGIYVPFTFIIKACMAVAVYFITKRVKEHSFAAKIGFILLASITAEIIMVGGYFILEIFMYGFQGAISNIFGNVIQGVFGCVSSVLVYTVMNKANLFSYTDKLLKIEK